MRFDVYVQNAINMERSIELGRGDEYKRIMITGDSNTTSKIINHDEAYRYDDDLLVPQIKKVIYNPPATVIIWSDDTKTVVKCQEDDIYNKETGFLLCVMKKV